MRRLATVAATVALSVSLAAPATASQRDTYPPRPPGTGVFVPVPRQPSHGYVWVCKVYRGHFWLAVVCYPRAVR